MRTYIDIDMRYLRYNPSAIILILALFLCTKACNDESCIQSTGNTRKIHDLNQWRLEDLYPSPLHWERDFQHFINLIHTVSRLNRVTIQTSNDLYQLLSAYYAAQMRYERLLAYASLRKDLDITDGFAHSLYARIFEYNSTVNLLKTSLHSSILGLLPERLDAFLEDQLIKPYHHSIMKIFRMKPRRASPSVEKFMARTLNLNRTVSDAFQSLWELELPYREIETLDGQIVQVDTSSFVRLRTLPERKSRAKIFTAFFEVIHQFRDTMAVFLKETTNRYRFFAQIRGYRSNLEAALDQSAIPTQIYTLMIENVHKALPLFQRYLKLRKHLLGVEQLAYFDMYAPMVPDVNVRFSWQEAKTILRASTQPLGPQYEQVVIEALQRHWFDVFPSRVKKPGAYCLDYVYGSHPFLLINFNGDYNNLSSSVHEFGHASQGFLSNKHQPYQNAHYSQFLSEISAITNEHLLSHYLISKQTDPKARLYFLCHYLDLWRQILFRQCQFAEFELKMHTAADSGVSIDADFLDRIYLDLMDLYHGKDKDITHIDPIYATEWAYVQDLQEGFFVFQYVTSFVISRLISNQILQGNRTARDNFLTLLTSGDSDYPLNLLKITGIDITTSSPYEAVFRDYERLLVEAENLALQVAGNTPSRSAQAENIR